MLASKSRRKTLSKTTIKRLWHQTTAAPPSRRCAGKKPTQHPHHTFSFAAIVQGGRVAVHD